MAEVPDASLAVVELRYHLRRIRSELSNEYSPDSVFDPRRQEQ